MDRDTRIPENLGNDDDAENPRIECEGGDLITRYLKQLDVEYVFGIPGGAIEPLYNALARSGRGGGPRAIVARHETGAAFMAGGYASEAGKLGVVCTTTGPGATNAITGVASAYQNETPMLVITAQTLLKNFGKGAFQESSCTGINTLGMYQHCTRYNSFVSHIDQLEHKLVTAIMTANQSPSGPVHLSIPLDILRSPVPAECASFDLPSLLRQSVLLDHSTVDELFHWISKARQVVLLVGAGCGEAIGTILEFALLLNLPVIATPRGKGLISPYHPQFRGVFGFAGHQSAYDTVADPAVDLILGVGTALHEWDSSGWDKAILNHKLIHIDATEEHFTRSPMASLHVRGTILAVFQHLLTLLYERKFPSLVRLWRQKEKSAGKDKAKTASKQPGHEHHLPHLPDPPDHPARHFRLDEESKYLDDSTPIKPQRLMRELARLFPLNTRFLSDTGNSSAWAIHYLHTFDRSISGQRSRSAGAYNSSLEFSSMGWAIGTAVGVAMGRRDGPVVGIVGDGAVLMSGQEITVAVAEELTVIFVVLNDAALGMVKHGQQLAGAEQIAFALPAVDFCAMAKAMGADAHTIASPEDLLALDIEAICKRRGPTLLDVHIDPEELPPIGVRMKALAKNG